MKYDDLDWLKKQLSKIQSNEKDERDAGRKCQVFISKKGGQWEDKIWKKWGSAGRPRYEYDRTTPILDALVGELEQNEFAAKVSPAGGQATKPRAETLNSLVRSIQVWSDASHIYKKVARKLATTGFDCCRVIHDYSKPDSFDQDLIVKYIPNAIDRVYFDPNSEEQDRSDAEYVYVLQAVTTEEYEKKWPKGKKQSLDDGRQQDYYQEGKRKVITVGEILYKKRTKKTLVQMSNGDVFEKEASLKIMDDLALVGIMPIKEREVDDVKVYSRIFDAAGWLEDEKPTVFSLLPVVPFYHCFEIIEDKITWRRIVEKLMDPQRVFNYAVSRQIEEGALAPRKKIWMTEKQAEGNEDSLAKMNTSAAPVEFYKVDKDAPPPYETGGPQINPSLAATAQEASSNIEAIAGMYAANLAKNPGLQSGVAIELQQNKGDTGNSSFYVDIAKGITYLCKVLLDGAPIVYDTRRDILMASEDGTMDMVTLNDKVQDQQTGEWVSKNDIVGDYTVTCSMGAMFSNKMEAANNSLLEMQKVAPGTLENNIDIFMRNVSAPGMDKAAERAREQLFKAGKIPESQMTEQEKEQMMAMMSQPQQPDPAMVLAEAEMVKAQADMMDANNKQMQLQLEVAKIEDKQRNTSISEAEAMADINNTNADTAKKLAETEKISNESVSMAIDDIERMSDRLI